MKEIQLTQGQVAIVDDADFEWLRQWKWHAQQGNYKSKVISCSCNVYTRDGQVHLSLANGPGSSLASPIQDTYVDSS